MILRNASNDMLGLLGQESTPDREHKMLVALGTIRTCLDVHEHVFSYMPGSQFVPRGAEAVVSDCFGPVVDVRSTPLALASGSSFRWEQRSTYLVVLRVASVLISQPLRSHK
jgi:hypothetical protein